LFDNISGMDKTSILRKALELKVKERDLWDDPKQDGLARY
jgi:hypothetical protein